MTQPIRSYMLTCTVDAVKRELLAAREALQKNNDELVQVRQNQESMGQYMKQSAEAQSKLALIAENLNQRLKQVEQRTGTDREQDSQKTERDERTIPRSGQGTTQP